jgi:hypothetical protein
LRLHLADSALNLVCALPCCAATLSGNRDEEIKDMLLIDVTPLTLGVQVRCAAAVSAVALGVGCCLLLCVCLPLCSTFVPLRAVPRDPVDA